MKFSRPELLHGHSVRLKLVRPVDCRPNADFDKVRNIQRKKKPNVAGG